MKKSLFKVATMSLAMLMLLGIVCNTAIASEADDPVVEQEESFISGIDYSDYLPIGSVVLLKDSDAKVMIMGYLQAIAGENNAVVYDYCGCLFPSGYESADQVYLFNHEQIDEICFIGYLNQESRNLLDYVAEIRAEL